MGGKFRDLYNYCQTLTPRISRNTIGGKVKELTGKQFKVMKFGLDTKVLRGFFISADNVDHELIKQNGCNVIGLARDLNYCWERYVQAKELMHLFDDPDETTANPEDFEKLLGSISQPNMAFSPQTLSEAKAFWMALAAYCPEKSRDQFKEQLIKNDPQIDNYAIALQLRIPEQLVPSLLGPEFDNAMKLILS